jgi:hypothetical protein
MMANVSIKYLFPTDQIHNLSTWRFILHFKAPKKVKPALRDAVAGLKTVEWNIVDFPLPFDKLKLDRKNGTVGVPIEVSEENRYKSGSLQEYEGDFWKICGQMLGAGFGDIYYEAVDWKEQ